MQKIIVIDIITQYCNHNSVHFMKINRDDVIEILETRPKRQQNKLCDLLVAVLEIRYG